MAAWVKLRADAVLAMGHQYEQAVLGFRVPTAATEYVWPHIRDSEVGRHERRPTSHSSPSGGALALVIGGSHML